VLIDRAGTSEWTLVRQHLPGKPVPAHLPKSVLEAQGIE
jgi:hypothetical protein